MSCRATYMMTRPQKRSKSGPSPTSLPRSSSVMSAKQMREKTASKVNNPEGVCGSGAGCWPLFKRAMMSAVDPGGKSGWS